MVPATKTWTGGYKAVGKNAEEAIKIYDDTKRLEDAGVIGVEMELVPTKVAEYITQNSDFNQFRNLQEVESWIYHRRGDNSVHKWYYTNQDRNGDQGDDTGEIGGRELHDEESAE